MKKTGYYYLVTQSCRLFVLLTSYTCSYIKKSACILVYTLCPLKLMNHGVALKHMTKTL